MHPTPAQLAYLAAMMIQLRLDFPMALCLANLHTEADELWALRLHDALLLMQALELEKHRRGFPQLHLE